ncbi:dienelactone hydrolase family protein [Ferrovibrio sp.]|uniref:dienelactone hydrolase family protein n=1 Tax=Ferrovibrio sp. TaxID=1917215 RepID=UPI002627F510|nr:dienelactone hydrolase family protein [Ferrovibrio sp.]
MRKRMLALLAMMLAVILASAGGAAWAAEETVRFPALHDGVELVGYLFLPRDVARPVPALVLMHGRAGAYSSAAKGVYTAKTLSQRHRQWAQWWADQGYAALIVDGFGPRGYPAGFGRFTYKDRPAELDETEARPQDAYAGLRYLRGRPEIAGARIGIMGWSNGGSTVLAAMARNAPGLAQLGGPEYGFRAGLALYPGCGLKDKFKTGLLPYAPTRIYAAENDDEVSSKTCLTLTERSRARGADLAAHVYPGAVHGFDDPAPARQAVPANRDATADVAVQALAFFAERLK